MGNIRLQMTPSRSLHTLFSFQKCKKDSHFAATILDMRTSFSFELPFCRSPELGKEPLLLIGVFWWKFVSY